ncbi:UvrD/REP helicase [Sulfuricurvum kujiense DSM 16994]|uniref:DNA 3'-5' helicase n=1 Tax=Sulfuricurvum kujiense (strain ATCC BAA-921 / DSM 16994 / JCM 11577 / YK-1) TaxID=709032 RepID=E4U0W5_SULKY|nr:UvrD-helicase domain-containing protein [Sulfuricurvum kujiense]ADR34367.1 UvrD/REP helicase [Sulfuricurvum kujiense DSM 16994]
MNKFDIFNHVAISAGAGSGKTYTLSRRYINILVGFNLFYEGESSRPMLEALSPARPNEIVTITYTEAGALEMKSRIFSLIQNTLRYIEGKLDLKHDDYDSIHKALNPLDQPWIEHVQSMLEHSLRYLSSATISTIHSYCLDLIEQFGDYLKLDSKPQIIGDDEKILAYTDAYRAVLSDEPEIIKEINQTISLYKLSQIAQKYSFNAQFREAFNNYALLCDDKEFSLREIWMASHLSTYREHFEKGFSALGALATQDPSKSDYCDAILANAKTLLQGHGEWFEYPGQFRKNKNIEEDTFESVKGLRDALKELKWTMIDPDAERYYVSTLKYVHALFVKVYERFRLALREKGYTDFETILEQANMLLEKDIALSTRYFMVDEFQDTNSYQWGIVTKAAAKNNANIFIVGDEKQSIFAFQGADVSVFAKASRSIGIEKPLSMEVNRRSDRSIIDLVNDVFAPAMAKKESIALEPINCIGEFRADDCIALFNTYTAQPRIFNDFEARYEPLLTPDTKGEGTIAILATPVDHTIAECEDECNESLQELRHIASFIHEVTQGKHPQYSDVAQAYSEGKKAIAVLFDSRKHMLPLKQCLLELGLRAKVSDSGNFFETKEVNDIFIVLKLLSIMDNLDWENLRGKEKYVISGALRSNILRCSADEIEYCLRVKRLPEILFRWKALSFYTPLHKLVQNIVEERALLHLYRHIDGYEQRAANIEQLIDMAHEYSTRMGSNLKGFSDELEAFIHNENVIEEEAFVIEEGVGSIEIVTMHGSKGLEWPMVIIGAMNRSFLGMSKQETLVYDRFENKELIGFKIGEYEPLVYKFIKERINQKHLAERKRLFYVAMTRPEHHLVLSTAINNYEKGPRLCYNCGSNNYFTLVNNVLGIDYEELYERHIDQIKNISIYYPGEWSGNDATNAEIEVIPPKIVEPQQFSRFSFICPSGTVNPLSFLEEREFDAGTAGSVVHKILENHWHELENDNIYERYFNEYNVPEEFKNNIIRMSKVFMKSRHFTKLKNGAEAYFEHDFVMHQDGNQIRGSIDLFYYDDEANGWVIVDFKTTALNEKSPEDVIIENGYDKQLEFYGTYLESVIGDEIIISKEICWLS